MTKTILTAFLLAATIGLNAQHGGGVSISTENGYSPKEKRVVNTINFGGVYSFENRLFLSANGGAFIDSKLRPFVGAELLYKTEKGKNSPAIGAQFKYNGSIIYGIKFGAFLNSRYLLAAQMDYKQRHKSLIFSLNLGLIITKNAISPKHRSNPK
jgi:hypothetical protein